MGFRSLKEKITERELDEESKRLYKASGWKAAKGGWAADFGPNHTQKLYTGPDRYHAFMHDRKSASRVSGDEEDEEQKGGRESRGGDGERILEDEMLLSLAKDVYSEKNTLRRGDSSKSTIAFTVPVQKQVSLASSGRRVSALTSDSGSSGSLDAGVVGAGLDEEFGEDFGAADELFGKLQRSVSLKAAAGTNE